MKSSGWANSGGVGLSWPFVEISVCEFPEAWAETTQSNCVWKERMVQGELGWKEKENATMGTLEGAGERLGADIVEVFPHIKDKTQTRYHCICT